MLPMLLTIVLLFAAAVPSPAVAQTPASAGDREIVALGGDLYRVRDGARHSVFAVTSGGIVVVDPLSVATAQWLSEQLAARFPDVPVRYVVLTHHHADRAAGAGVFTGATIVGHEAYEGAFQVTRLGRANAYRFVPKSPALTYSDRHTIEIGGRRVELSHAGPFHAADMTVVAFPAARLAFVADPPPIQSPPFTFGVLIPTQIISWLNVVARVNADTILFGDGSTMRRDEIAALAEYLSRLRAAVLNGYERGRSLDQMQRTLLLDAYKASPHYAARREQIAAVYEKITYRRIDLILVGLANYLPEHPPDYCAAFDRCDAGGVVPAGAVGAAVQIGRRFGVQADVTLSQQFWSTRSRPLFDEELVMRPLQASFLVRYGVSRGGGLSLIGGVSNSFGDVRGMDRVAGQPRPAGGRHPISATDSRLAFTGGIELAARMGRMRLVLPVRATLLASDPPRYWPSRFSVNAGAGISLPLGRRVD
jgi:glyoxylase-like metal-dependent hydrolase (beta-lactamase superfamily II)